MNKVYTSNYARQGNNPKSFGISFTTPKWFEGTHLNKLAPTWQMVDAYKGGRMDEQLYTKEYLALLTHRKIDPTQFQHFPNGTILLCYESPGEFCHRRVLAGWVERETGFIIPEWKNESEMKEIEKQAFVDSALEF